MSKEILKNLKKLKETESIGKADSSWVKENREILMHQINPTAKVSDTPFYTYYLQYLADVLKYNVVRPAMLAVLVFTAYFGYSAFTLAAMASLPGDSLYPVKILSERVQLVATVSEENKVKLKMDFVSRRGEELKQVVKSDRDDKNKATKVAVAVRNITTEVKSINESMDKIASSRSASNVISTAKVVDDKTLKIEKDIVEAHAGLSAEVKKEVATEVKEALAETSETGSRALTIIVDKSADKTVKDTPASVSDKELTARVSERIKNTENALEIMTTEVNRITSSTNSTILSKDTLISSTSDSVSNLKEAVKEVSSKPQEAQTAINEAKTLLDQKDFNSALQKITESKIIVAEVIERTPAIDETIRIKAEMTSTTLIQTKETSTSSTTDNKATTSGTTTKP